VTGGALADGCGDVGSPVQPDVASSSTAVTARAVIRTVIESRVFARSLAAAAASPLALSGFILRQIVPHDPHLTTGQARRVAMELAVELPGRAALVAVRMDLVSVGKP
jgi:hypothetical protein